jgi:2'-phosphotransferase
VDVRDIEQHRRFCDKFTVADIQRVVAENDKQRFTLRTHPVSGKLQIKANQGHSIHVRNFILNAVTKFCMKRFIRPIVGFVHVFGSL